MKKLFLTVILLCAACLTYAQGSKWELGIEGGPNTAFISSSWVNFAGWKTGFSAGITAQYNISHIFSLKGGIIYEEKGDESDQEWTDSLGRPINGSAIIEKDNLSYLVLPLFAKASFGTKVKFLVNAGPYFGYLLHATRSSSIHGIPGYSDTKYSNDETSNFKHGDIGAGAGIGLEMPIKTRFVINLEFRYNQGLLNTNNYTSSLAPPMQPPVLHNQSANLLLGFRYKL